jgi:hypothetical protein
MGNCARGPPKQTKQVNTVYQPAGANQSGVYFPQNRGGLLHRCMQVSRSGCPAIYLAAKYYANHSLATSAIAQVLAAGDPRGCCCLVP